MTLAERYAKTLQRDYFIEPVSVSLDDETYDTADKVARAVLPPAKYLDWQVDFMKWMNELRKKYGMEEI